MNTELLRKIRRAILRSPKNFDMARGISEQPCGTVGCIAGYAAAIHSVGSFRLHKALDKLRHDEACPSVAWADVQDIGAVALNLNNEERRRLFYVLYWPEKFVKLYDRFPKDKIWLAKVTAERIDHFINTGGRE